MRTIPSKRQGLTFTVDDVQQAEHALRMASLDKTFENRSGRSILVMPECDRMVVASPARISAFHPLALHGLVEAVHLAFSQHRALVLSPDDIWLTIAQGFGHHINTDAERLRYRMVAHEGRKTLAVKVDAFDARAIAAFSDLIERVPTLSFMRR